MEMNQPLTTTLRAISRHESRKNELNQLLKALGKTAVDADPLEYAKIVEVLGFDAAFWLFTRDEPYQKQSVLFGIWCARQVPHLQCDKHSVEALSVSELYLDGAASKDEMMDAKAAFGALSDPSSYHQAVYQAMWSAFAVTNAVCDYSPEYVGNATAFAARAIWIGSFDTAMSAQKARFLEIVGGGQ